MVDTRDRILDATDELFRRYGYTGSGLKQIVANANAPFGSIYHFFPDGKEQLGEEVVRRAAQMYLELVTAVWDAAPDPVRGLRDVFSGAAMVLEETDYIDPCPIGTVALEMSSSSEPLRQATADAFTLWIDAATTRLTDAGLTPRVARQQATSIIMLLQGAFMLGRSLRDTAPLEIAGKQAAESLTHALAARRKARSSRS